MGESLLDRLTTLDSSIFTTLTIQSMKQLESSLEGLQQMRILIPNLGGTRANTHYPLVYIKFV